MESALSGFSGKIQVIQQDNNNIQFFNELIESTAIKIAFINFLKCSKVKRKIRTIEGLEPNKTILVSIINFWSAYF